MPASDKGVPRSSRFHLKPQARDNLAGYLFTLPWTVHLLFLIGLTMLASLGISFTETDFLTKLRFVGLGNYQGLMRDPLFWKSLRNTAYYTFASVPLSVIFALAIALLLNLKVKGLSVYRLMYYTPSIVSGVAVAIIWQYVLNPRFGLLNLGLKAIGIRGPQWIYSQQWAMPAFIIMGVWGAGGNMLLYLAGLQGIPTTLYEAAKIDGANRWRRFWAVTVPMLSPTILFNLVGNLIGSWQIFSQSYLMTQGGPNNATLTMVLYLYNKGFQQFRFGYASAIAWVLFLIVLVFTFLLLRSSEMWVFYEGELRR
ncbi:MAG: sugar ABC transporter permease [Chloroflexi bacterium]|nr:sugar ABC transporter permease [Chloroflexota bacterium]